KRSMLEGSKQETHPKKWKPKSRLANDKILHSHCKTTRSTRSGTERHEALASAVPV
ncbi:hypothetical protein M405DRAFT_830857, partial [Rhizopogon salebrosus TDB-379]